MRKIFTLFAAMLLAITVNATERSVTAGEGNFSTAVSAASAGDVLVLANGDFTETVAVTIDKNLVIKAADNATPVINFKIGIEGGVRVRFIGIKFDASEITDNMIVAGDDAVSKYLYLENCSFSDYTADNALIICEAANKLDSVVVNNCTFSNIKRSCIYLANTSAVGLIITNSTFVNLVKGTNWNRAHIEALGASTRIEVDHCTFYNCQTMSTDYGVIGFQSDPCTNYLVQNCIFALPSDQANVRAIYLQQAGGYVKNCLTHHYTKSDAHPGIHSGPTISGCIDNTNPGFDDAAGGDFSLDDSSPAFNKGTDGKTLGDPRWWPVVSYPQTDFAAPGYNCTADDAIFISTTKYFLDESTDPNSICYNDENTPGPASWTIEATRACYIQATLDLGEKGSNWHNFEVKVLNEDGVTIDSISEGRPFVDEFGDKNTTKTISGKLAIPEAGIYTIQLLNNRHHSKSAVYKVTLTYLENFPSRPTVAAKGDWDSWTDELVFTPALSAKTASVKKTFTKGDELWFKMIIGGTYVRNSGENGWWFKRDANECSGITVTGDDKNMKFIADYTGEYTFTWTYETNKLTITFPEPEHENGWYLVGTFNEVNEWAVSALTPAKKFAVNPENNDEMIVTADLKVGDQFKAAYVYLDEITEYKPAGDNYTVVKDYEGDGKTIYFRILGGGGEGWFAGTLYVPKNEPTSIDNTVVGEKAVKFFENGQLFIQKDGKIYNLLGTIVK